MTKNEDREGECSRDSDSGLEVFTLVPIWFVVSFTVHDMKCPLRIIKDTGIFDLLLATILAQEERLDKLPGPILEMQGQRKVHQKDKVVVLALVHFSCD